MSTNPSHARTSRLATALALVAMLAAPLTLVGCARPAEAPLAQAPVAVPSQPTTTLDTTTLPTSTAEPTPTPTTPSAPQPVAQRQVRAYFVRGESLGIGKVRNVPALTPAKGAMRRLLAGPTAAEKAWGLSSEIPAGTKLLGVSIFGGVATVDLSKRFESGGGTLTMTLRIAQVVNTLTQFSGVNAVAFRIGGRQVDSIGGEGVMVSPPVGRADFADSLPAIMIENPLPGTRITNPVRLSGSANVFEGQFIARLTDSAGKTVAEKAVRATSGTGSRGTFGASLRYKTPRREPGWLIVYEPSPKNGAPINRVRIPVVYR